MAIKGELTTQPISWLVRNYKEKKLRTEISIQRRDVWDIDRKSNLIVSGILDIPIENLLFEEVEGTDEYYVLDGKQRILTICSYIDSEKEFPLSKKIKHPIIDGVDIRGLKFSQLPENLQNRLLDRNFSATIMRPLTDIERPLVFFMRNQAVPLTNMEISRAAIGEEGMAKLAAITEHPFMSKVKITVPGRRKYQDMQIIVEYIMLKTYEGDIGFTPLELASFCDHIHDNPDVIDEDKLTEIMNYLDEAFDKKRSYLKKANLPMVLLIAEEAQNKVNPVGFAKWADDLFEVLSKDEAYAKLCKSYKRADVQGRLKTIKEDAAKNLYKGKGK